MSDAPDVAALTSEQRVELAQLCMDRLWRDDEDPLVESFDDSGNLIRWGRYDKTTRPFAIFAHLDDDEDLAADLGDIELQVSLDNRVGVIDLVHEDEADPEATWLTEVIPELYVMDPDDAVRQWMLDTVRRLGDDFCTRALAFLRKFEHYTLAIGNASLTVALADLSWDDEDWTDANFDLDAEIAELDALAAIVEANLPDTFTACAHCGGRYNAAASPTCPHCGAAP